jgi:hypothetical protein
VPSTGKYVQETTYFEKPGFVNTEDVLSVVNRRLARGDIDAVTVATSSGRTALLARQVIDPTVRIYGICFQPHLAGKYTMVDPDLVAQARALGVTFIPDEPRVRFLREVSPYLRRALYFFGDGTKVAVEVAIMAVEAGLIPAGKSVVSVAGTKPGGAVQGGADTAIVVMAAGYEQLKDVFVQEILAKPLMNFRSMP